MKRSGISKPFGLILGCCFCACRLSVAEEVKPLESYPEVKRIWMGMEEGSIRPGAYQQVRSLAEGYVSLLLKDGQAVKKGEPWAIIDPEQIEIERESLQLEDAKLEQQLKKDAEDALNAQLLLDVEIHQAEIKRQTFLDAAEDPSIPAALRNRSGEAIQKMNERLDLLREKADSKTLERNRELAETEGRLVVSRKRKQFLELEKRSRLVAEFDGELRFSDTVNKAVADNKNADNLLWVSANEHIATIVNDENYEIVVAATSPLLSQIAVGDLLIFLQDPKTGSLIAGDYLRTDEVDTGGEIRQNYIFTIQEDAIGNARHASGQRGLVHVYRKFPHPLRLIHKKDIAFAASDVLATSGWNGLVRNLWPGSEVVQVGPQTIAVKPRNED